MKKPKYKVGNTVILRMPTLNINSYFLVTQLDNKKMKISDIIDKYSIFTEVLSVSSMSLRKAIEENVTTEKQKDALIKYLIHSTARPTPYGLFSGIGCAKFSNKTNIYRKDLFEGIEKSCMVDMKWFYALIEKLEKDDDIINNTRVMFNDQCYVCGERIINPYIGGYGQISNLKENQNVDKLRIRYTKQVRHVEQLAKDFISYSKLKSTLVELNGGVSDQVIDKFLHQLLENEFLLTELRVPLNEKDPLKALLTILEKYQLNEKNCELRNQLQMIENDLQEYVRTEVGKGETQYSKICNRMDSIIQSKDFLNTITKINLIGDSISDNVRSEIKLLSDLLVSLSYWDTESSNLKSFKHKYIEQFGTNSEISLLQLFEQSTDLIKSYISPPEKYSDDSSQKKKKIREYIQDKILLCLNKGLNELMSPSRKNRHRKAAKS